MATAESRRGIDNHVYNAAVTPGNTIHPSQLEAALSSVTRGGQNSVLHLAASVGNIALVDQIVQFQCPLLVVKATNDQGNTALHLAAQGGFCDVVETLLLSEECVVNVYNKKNETPLLKAYESGNLATVKVLFDADPSSIRQKTEDGRSCLYVAINRGDLGLGDHILRLKIAKELIQEKYKNGDTILHIAVSRNDVDMIKRLTGIEPELCYRMNDTEETPLCVAAKLGHLEAVQELIECLPDAVEMLNSCGMNVLHLAAQVSQVRIVDYLNKKVSLLELVNNGVQKKPKEEKPMQSGGEKDPAEKKEASSEINEGDTPLHIAARNKSFNMVESLLRIRGINKFTFNKEGLTALDIVRGNTQYYECDKIISVLASYPSKRKPFLYSAPKVSAGKHEAAVKMVDKTYEERREKELVVAVLLATMSFTAAFTVPGGFEDKEGSPLLLGLDTFKLFLIFDCVAFFLSLFVVLMWQMSTPITTGDKVLFLCVTNLVVCATFAFTAYGFMLAVYAMLANKALTLGWVVLGSCIFICTCAYFTYFYMVAKFTMKKARFNHLNGLAPYPTDRAGEWAWMKLERCGPLDWLRRWKSKGREIFKCTTVNRTKIKARVPV